MTTQYANIQSIAGQATTPTTLQMQLFPLIDGVPDTTPDYTSDAVNAHSGVSVIYIGSFGESAVISGDYFAVLSRVSDGAVLATGNRTFAGTNGETASETPEVAVLNAATQTQINRIEATASGTLSGAGTSTEVFVGPSATVTVTVDASGNRSAVVVS